ncbi:TIGR02234 family membrane protein [Actinospica durhamensis]|uniref:TIGR02234 family membrane protein n=1 Tax=Actinospica durhamensis TaxID=1508375 RepID=A0A941ISB6_9ACTN|nr:TIGR02234 family membrane protein [Actinospica durhamensis]MBR7836202.1 TIGR02234 family membrane protein [Actinospica durhamensis]
MASAAQSAPTGTAAPAPGTAPASEPAATVTEQARVRPARRAARAKFTAALLAAVGSGVILLTIGRGWATGEVTDPITFKVSASGSQLTGVPYALGLAGLAGSVALLAVRNVGRHLVGALLALAGAGSVYAVADRLHSLDSALRTSAGSQGLGSDAVISHVSNNVWPYLTILGGVVLCLAGLYTLVRGRGWSGLGGRYETPAVSAEAAVEAARERAVTARDIWDAQGRGNDLT